jgi:hypothetical protein
MRRGSECHPRNMKRRKNMLESTLTIGASTIWRGRSTSLLIASLARSTRTTRERTATRPTLPPLPQRPLPSTLATRPFWPLLQTSKKNDGSRQHVYGISWAMKHRTISYDLPTSAPNPSQNHPHAMPPCLSHQKLDKDDPKGSPLAPGRKTSCCSMQERVKRYKKPVRELQDKVKDQRMLRTYLFLAAFATFKVGCRIESFIRCFSGPPIWDPTCLALQSETALQTVPLLVRFDSDSYLFRVDNHTSRCMANARHLFEDLRLDDNKGQVDRINSGLNIAGRGAFKFNITDNHGKVHTIKIPDSLYVPNLTRCLLLPQHWAQEAGDKQSWMGNYRECRIFGYFSRTL